MKIYREVSQQEVFERTEFSRDMKRLTNADLLVKQVQQIPSSFRKNKKHMFIVNPRFDKEFNYMAMHYREIILSQIDMLENLKLIPNL